MLDLMFENIPKAARKRIIPNFNLMASTTEQNMYLCGLISLRPVKQRRPQKPKEEASFYDVAYPYRVKYVDKNSESKEIDVCYKAFSSLYGIGNVRRLEIFCDSCGGKNKNYTMCRFFHYLIHIEKRFDFIQVTFLINFGLVYQRTRVELPKEWADVLRSSRSKPSPFDVKEVSQEYFRSWTQHFTSRFKRQCQFLS
ncbi:hypothetical protein ILUMI_15378 [Ignelater luminosus]|uniref:Uncharacterized protein n=1 Tax=Ignelater luminosus TaxID=2038154 RepID=A0A8K0CNR4_IGNLU|nr:hypothetical protein ILUMI_15378 [Ignelater luminosus]